MRRTPLASSAVLAAMLAARAAAAPPTVLEDSALPPLPAMISTAPASGSAAAAPATPAIPAASAGAELEPGDRRREPGGDYTAFFDGGAARPDLTLSNQVVSGRHTAISRALPKGIGTIEAGLRGGVIHPGAGAGDVMQASPYAGVDVSASGDRGVEWSLRASHVLMNVRSKAPAGTAGLRSPVAGLNEDDAASITKPVQTVYADAGKSFRAGRNVGVSVFGGASAWGAMADGSLELNAGAALAAKTSRRTMLSAALDASLGTGHTTMYRNEFALLPEAVRARVAFSRAAMESAWKASVSAVMSPSFTAIEPSLLFASGANALEVSSRFQRSKTAFVPNERGLATSWNRRLSERVAMETTVALRERRYAMAPGALRTGTGSIGFTVAPGRVRVEAAPLKPLGAPRLDPAAAKADRDLSLGPTEGLIAMTMGFGLAKNYDDFTRILAENIKTYAGLLSALSSIGGTFQEYNGNEETAAHPNANSMEEIFRQVQASWTDHKKRRTGVCITQSQFNAGIVEAVARRNGLNVKAMTSAFVVPTDGGKALGGHSFLAIIGPDGRVTIQDWRGLTPMGTTDVLEAFRMYQELAGVPAMFFDITDPQDGKHRSFAFTEEGRVILEHAGALGRTDAGYRWTDDVHGAELTLDRFQAKAAEQAKKRRWQ